MCISDPIPTTNTREMLEAASDNYAAPEPEDMDSALFSEISNKVDMDATWLAAAPRKESELLVLYFGDQVSSLKDLLDYRDLLWQCIASADIEGLIVINDIEHACCAFGPASLEFEVAG